MANANGWRGIALQITATVIMAGLAAFMGMRVGLAKTEVVQTTMEKRIDRMEDNLERRLVRIENNLTQVMARSGWKERTE